MLSIFLSHDGNLKKEAAQGAMIKDCRSTTKVHRNYIIYLAIPISKLPLSPDSAKPNQQNEHPPMEKRTHPTAHTTTNNLQCKRRDSLNCSLF
jgi:hypothetical protein